MSLPKAIRIGGYFVPASWPIGASGDRVVFDIAAEVARGIPARMPAVRPRPLVVHRAILAATRRTLRRPDPLKLDCRDLGPVSYSERLSACSLVWKCLAP